MFRLMFAPKATPGKFEIPVLDKVFEDFNIFKIDMNKRIVRVGLSVNPNQGGCLSWDEMVKCLTEGWDVYKVKYEFDGENGSMVSIHIPDGHEVIVVLK